MYFEFSYRFPVSLDDEFFSSPTTTVMPNVVRHLTIEHYALSIAHKKGRLTTTFELQRFAETMYTSSLRKYHRRLLHRTAYRFTIHHHKIHARFEILLACYIKTS